MKLIYRFIRRKYNQKYLIFSEDSYGHGIYIIRGYKGTKKRKLISLDFYD
jgi:hypothetical protein